MGKDLSVMSEWAVRDRLTGALYPQPNQLIAEAVATMHGQCDVVPCMTVYEYGVQRPLSEEAWGPGHYTVAEYSTRALAEEDMAYFDVKNGTLVRRRKAGPWEEVA